MVYGKKRQQQEKNKCTATPDNKIPITPRDKQHSFFAQAARIYCKIYQ
jgi:hypothetical protein